MLTGNLVRVKMARERVVPLYIDREAARWLEAAESLLLLFREGIGMTARRDRRRDRCAFWRGRQGDPGLSRAGQGARRSRRV